MIEGAIRERLLTRAKHVACVLPASAVEQLCAYFELVRRWNRRLSLTALPVEQMGDEAIDRLLLEPAIAARFLPSSPSSFIDIGSGGGSPALPLKILIPDAALTMVEAREKKAAFLRDAVRQLNLRDASVEARRYEELLKTRQLTADVVTIRAVKVSESDLALLSKFLKPAGSLFIFAAEGAVQEPRKPLEKIGSHTLLLERGSRLEILKRA